MEFEDALSAGSARPYRIPFPADSYPDSTNLHRSTSSQRFFITFSCLLFVLLRLNLFPLQATFRLSLSPRKAWGLTKAYVKLALDVESLASATTDSPLWTMTSSNASHQAKRSSQGQGPETELGTA